MLSSLKKLLCFNGEKVKDEPNYGIKNQSKLIAENSWTFHNKPRSLHYLFVTDLINEKNDEMLKHKFEQDSLNDNATISTNSLLSDLESNGKLSNLVQFTTVNYFEK